jgi:hypothetical protein
MKKSEIINGYLAAERPYDVCMHSRYGGYLEYAKVESGIMFEDNARMVCESYADSLRKNPSETFIGVCVRKGGMTVYEVKVTK